MTIASRTPEGFPSECPLCGAEVNLEYSEPGRDAPCPQCGCLLWLSTHALGRLEQWLSETEEVPDLANLANWPLEKVASDSLELVEIVMELEEEFDLNIPASEVEDIRTVGDVIRYLQHRTGEA